VDRVDNFTFLRTPPAPLVTPTLPPETPILSPRCKFDTERYGRGY
jgi:hypothetical protein